MKKSVTVLGIHDGHNAGAALIRDGKVLAAISEERLVNIKNFSGPPLLSIAKVYEISNVPFHETDLIAIGCLVRVGAAYPSEDIWGKLQVKLAPLFHSHFFAKSYVKFFHSFREMNNLKDLFTQLRLSGVPITFVEHHLTHAATAFYQRPWREDAIILTLDGAGDGLSATVSIGSGFHIKRLAETTFYDSLSNNVYSEITGFLGMKRWEHEYKVMGLAPYGKDDGLINEFKKVVRIHPDRPLEFQNIFNSYLYEVNKKLSKILIGRRFDNIAWATQTYFENLLVQWVENAISYTGIHNIVCGGGSFLNVKANKIIREMPAVKNLFVYPAADDGGTPVGAALEGYVRYCREKNIDIKIPPLSDIYYGQEYTNDEIEQELSSSKWMKNSKKLQTGKEKYIAALLAKGEIVARFDGRDEWGPRALGNRSILADPRDFQIVHKLNFAVKQRDFWMPFAASILEEDAKDYIKDFRPSRYMIEAFDTKMKGELLAAAIHPYDRTCRPQTVNDWNQSYRKIIEEFQKLTGIAGILNTSFNLHGNPLVGTPAIAIATFSNSGIDALLLGDWIIEK